MASGQRSKEQRGETAVPGGAPDNNLERLAYVHRGGQTKGEHLEAKGYEEMKANQDTGSGRGQTEQRRGTGVGRNDQMDRHQGGARGDPSVKEGIDIDESTM